MIYDLLVALHPADTNTAWALKDAEGWSIGAAQSSPPDVWTACCKVRAQLAEFNKFAKNFENR